MQQCNHNKDSKSFFYTLCYKMLQINISGTVGTALQRPLFGEQISQGDILPTFKKNKETCLYTNKKIKKRYKETFWYWGGKKWSLVKGALDTAHHYNVKVIHRGRGRWRGKCIGYKWWGDWNECVKVQTFSIMEVKAIIYRPETERI